MNKSNKPNHAFILAAGQGTRLRPYTDTVPKPLVSINDRPLLDYTIDKLKKSDIQNVTINAHYLGDSIVNYAKSIKGLAVHISREDTLLDTGGGIKTALHTIGDAPFYIINGDALWDDGAISAFDRLAAQWNPDIMDILLLLQPLSQMHLTEGVGDYNIDEEGKAVRSLDKTGSMMFGGIRIANPAIFANTPDDAFSFLTLMDKAEKEGRLYAVVHDNDWHHISTPQDLERVDTAYRKLSNKAKTA